MRNNHGVHLLNVFAINYVKCIKVKCSNYLFKQTHHGDLMTMLRLKETKALDML